MRMMSKFFSFDRTNVQEKQINTISFCACEREGWRERKRNRFHLGPKMDGRRRKKLIYRIRWVQIKKKMSTLCVVFACIIRNNRCSSIRNVSLRHLGLCVKMTRLIDTTDHQFILNWAEPRYDVSCQILTGKDNENYRRRRWRRRRTVVTLYRGKQNVIINSCGMHNARRVWHCCPC